MLRQRQQHLLIYQTQRICFHNFRDQTRRRQQPWSSPCSQLSCFLFHLWLTFTCPQVSSSPPKVSSLLSSINPTVANSKSKDNFDEDKHFIDDPSIPSTVFAPSGRIYAVENALRDTRLPSWQLSSSSTYKNSMGKDNGSENLGNDNDVGSVTVMCLKCNGGNDVVVVSVGCPSPNLCYNGCTDNDYKNDFDANGKNDDMTPLLWSEVCSSSQPSQMRQPLPKHPLSLPFTNLCLASGGRMPDSAILLRRMEEIVIQLYGERCFGSRFGGAVSAGRGHNGSNCGEVFGIPASTIARSVADILQLPTQTSGKGKLARAESIIVGTDNHDLSQCSDLSKDDDSAIKGNRELSHYGVTRAQCEWKEDSTTPVTSHLPTPRLEVWKIDPSGRFWACHATALGGGADSAESYLLDQIRHNFLKKRNIKENKVENYEGGEEFGHNEEEEKKPVIITEGIVESYLNSLSSVDGMKLACECLMQAVIPPGGWKFESKFEEDEEKKDECDNMGYLDDEAIKVNENHLIQKNRILWGVQGIIMKRTNLVTRVKPTSLLSSGSYSNSSLSSPPSTISSSLKSIDDINNIDKQERKVGKTEDKEEIQKTEPLFNRNEKRNETAASVLLRKTIVVTEAVDSTFLRSIMRTLIP